MPFKGPYPTVFGGNTPAMVMIALQNLSDFAAEPGFCVLVRRPRYELRAADGVTCCCRPARPHR